MALKIKGDSLDTNNMAVIQHGMIECSCGYFPLSSIVTPNFLSILNLKMSDICLSNLVCLYTCTQLTIYIYS